MIRLKLHSFICLVIVVWIACHFGTVESTNVKWTAAGNIDPKNAAHTAPRSQKYWDENGIERPDYAKTDAELAQEKGVAGGSGGSSGSSNGALFLFLLVLVGALYFHVQRMEQGGYKLGGSSSRGMSEEDARLARLAKFE